MRGQTSSLIEEVKRRAEALQQERNGGLQSLTIKQSEKSQNLKESLQTARGKRELVKGVLRVSALMYIRKLCTWRYLSYLTLLMTHQGLILESGLDWYGNRELRDLMLELGDDDLDASEDEPHFDSDSSSEDG